MRMRHLMAAAFVLTAGVAASGAAQACVSVQAAVVGISYNPISPSGAITQTVNLTVQRPTTGARTEEARLVLLKSNSLNSNFDIRVGADSVLATSPGPVINMAAPATPNQIVVNFGDATQSDQVVVPVTVVLPAGVDLPAGQSLLPFDVKYACRSVLGPSDIVQGSQTGGLQLSLNVLSALQASFAGVALDFGEIGTLTTTGLGAAGTGVTERTGAIRVASSGPYSVAMSASGNYRMTYPGGSVLVPGQRIPFEVDFLNQSARFPIGFTSTLCTAAGAGGRNLDITARLLEGGQGKVPAPVYQDVLTVTFTPLVAPFAGTPSTCN